MQNHSIIHQKTNLSPLALKCLQTSLEMKETLKSVPK